MSKYLRESSKVDPRILEKIRSNLKQLKKPNAQQLAVLNQINSKLNGK